MYLIFIINSYIFYLPITINIYLLLIYLSNGVRKKESAKSKRLYTPWATHGPCHVYLCVCFSPSTQYRHVICQRHSDCHSVIPLSLNNDDDHRKRRPPPHTMPRNRRTTGDSDTTTTAHKTRSTGFCEKQGGPNESFGPRYVLFFHSFILFY